MKSNKIRNMKLVLTMLLVSIVGILIVMPASAKPRIDSVFIPPSYYTTDRYGQVISQAEVNNDMLSAVGIGITTVVLIDVDWENPDWSGIDKVVAAAKYVGMRLYLSTESMGTVYQKYGSYDYTRWRNITLNYLPSIISRYSPFDGWYIDCEILLEGVNGWQSIPDWNTVIDAINSQYPGNIIITPYCADVNTDLSIIETNFGGFLDQLHRPLSPYKMISALEDGVAIDYFPPKRLIPSAAFTSFAGNQVTNWGIVGQHKSVCEAKGVLANLDVELFNRDDSQYIPNPYASHSDRVLRQILFEGKHNYISSYFISGSDIKMGPSWCWLNMSPMSSLWSNDPILYNSYQNYFNNLDYLSYGNSITNRPYVVASAATYLDQNFQIAHDGIIETVYVWANSNNSKIKVKVFRDDGSNWVFVGESELITLQAGYNAISGLSIIVKSGDVMGFYNAAGYSVKFSQTGTSKASTGDITTTTPKSSWSSAARNYAVGCGIYY